MAAVPFGGAAYRRRIPADLDALSRQRLVDAETERKLDEVTAEIATITRISRAA
jgi:hypothetical protein